MSFNGNAKLYYVKDVRRLLDDILLVEGGERSPDVLGTLQVNRDVVVRRLKDIQEEADDLVARATRSLERSSK